VPLALEWTDPLALLAYVPSAAIIVSFLVWLYRRQFAPNPLVAFGHPEDRPPLLYSVGGTDAEWEAQMREYESERLSRLIFSYLIENKGDTPIRNATTGIRTRDGREHQFEDWFVQILRGDREAPVENVQVPHELHAGMTDENRAVNFLFWLRFEDDKGRRWEAVYDARSRDLSYTRL
jgi:hypothetical protein